MNNATTPDISSQAQVFRASKGCRLFSLIFLPALTAVFLGIAATPLFIGKPIALAAALLCVILGLGFASLFAYGLYAIFVGRLELYPDRIREVTPLRTRTLFLKDISGFRIFSAQGSRTLILVPRNPKANKAIKTALLYERQDELFAWLSLRLTNLDAEARRKKAAELLQDPRLGQTADERQTRHVQLTRWTKALNGATFCITLWALFWPTPYPLAIYACCLMPWLALAAVCASKNLIRLGVEANSAYPDVSVSFLMPGIVLALRAFQDFNILSWKDFWPVFTALSLAQYLCTLFVDRNLRAQKASAACLVLFCAIYAYASVICINAVTDRSVRTVYQAQVLDKRLSRGKHDSYYLLLSPWGNRPNSREVDVGRRVFNRHGVGETVHVVVRKGRLRIPWYYVE